MAYFVPIKNLYGLPEIYDDVIIGDSATITAGGLVTLASGFVAATTAGDRVYGLCVGFVATLEQSRGIPLDKLSATNDFDGTYTAGGLGTNKYVATSDNQTDKKIAARIRIDPGMVMTNEPDAALATTTGSDLKGNFTDVTSDTQVDENNSTNSFTTIAQLVIHGRGGDLNFEEVSTTFGIYQIMEKQEMGG